MAFDNMYFLQWGNNEQLKVKLPEKFQAITGTFVAAAAKRFIDHHKPETATFDLAKLEAELIGEGAGQYGICQFLLLSTAFST